MQGKSQCFHKLTTVSSNEAHGSQITDVKGFAIKMLVVIIYTLLLIQKSLLHPSKLLDCLVCLQWTILRVCIQFWAGTSVFLRALWVSGHSLNVKKRSIWCQVQWLRHKIWLTFLLSKVFLDNKFFKFFLSKDFFIQSYQILNVVTFKLTNPECLGVPTHSWNIGRGQKYEFHENILCCPGVIGSHR